MSYPSQEPTEVLANDKGSISRLGFIGLTILVYFLLRYSYIHVISPLYGYMGLIDQVPSVAGEFAAFLIGLLPAFWAPCEAKRPSDFASLLLYFSVVMPMPLIAIFMAPFGERRALVLSLWIVGSYALFEIVRRGNRFFVPVILDAAWLINLAVPLLTVGAIISCLILTKFQFHFSFEDIYERRLDARAILPGGSLVGYLLAALKFAFTPIILVLALTRRSFRYIVLAVLAVAAIFSLDGSKDTIFRPLLLLTAAWIIGKRGKMMGVKTAFGIAAALAISLFEYAAVGNYFIAGTVIRRQLIVPAEMTAYYYDFFSQAGFTYFSDGIVGKILGWQKFDLAKAPLIGYEYLGKVESNANANLWASAYADLGIAGLILVSILAGVVLRIVDSYDGPYARILTGILALSFVMVWTQGAFETSLLTGGVLLGLVFLMFWPYKEFSRDGFGPVPEDVGR